MCVQHEGGRRQAGKNDEEQEPSAVPAGRKSLEAINAADNLVDALDLATHEERRKKVTFNTRLCGWHQQWGKRKYFCAGSSCQMVLVMSVCTWVASSDFG